MKTKHLFAAFMLPAIFAACSNEDFVSPQQAVDLSDRPLAGNVIFNFNTGADTRLDADFNWVVGDKIGACLMDEYKPNEGTPETNAPWMKDFVFVDYIQTNYRYNYTEEGTWENADLLCTGNYFFYYPYTAQLNARLAFEKYLNADQKLEGQDKASLRKLINDNQMYVGYNYVAGATEGDLQPLNVEMQPIFAFPAFTIENTGTKTRTITKIALQKQDGSNWDLVATIDPTDKTATELAQNPGAAVKWSDNPTLDKNAVASAKQIQVTMPEGTKLAAGGKLNTYIVVPAGEYAAKSDATTADKVTMYIYTTEGVVTADLSQKHINSGSSAVQYNVTNDVAFANISPEKVNDKYFLANITFDDLGVDTPAETSVSSTEDLDMYLSWFADYQGTGGTNLSITTIGDDVVLSKKAYDILKNNRTLNVTFVGDLTLAAEVGTDVLDLITIDNTEARDLTNLATINVPSTLGNNVTLINEGTATLTSTSDYKGQFINNGTMTINAGANKTVIINGADNRPEKFQNKGILVVESNLTINYNGIINDGTIEIKAGVTTAKIDNKFEQVTNGWKSGYIVVSQGAKWVTVGSIGGTNDGRIDNYGTISVPASAHYTNGFTKEITLGKDTYRFTPEIINYGKLETVTNNGLVTMKGENSEIKSATDSNGEIDNTECSRFVNKGTNETVFVKITAATETKAVSTLVGNAKASKVKFDNAGTLTITEEKDADNKLVTQTLIVDEIDITGNLNIAGENRTIRIYGNADGGSMTINSGTTLIKDYAHVIVGRSTSAATVTIVNGATLKVSNSAEFSGYAANYKAIVKGNVSNYGTMNNVDIQ